VQAGIASAFNHNGGLLKIGPDHKLWIGTGDAGTPSRSQDRSSLNGKILRLNLDGSVPGDNPFRDSPVYSMGHRNVQGLAFDSKNQPWAIEFGQNTWDELNRIQAGKNYGWPAVEGKGGGESGFVDPVVQWATSEASPSGMAIVNDVAYIGALRGQRLWQVPLDPVKGVAGKPKGWLREQFGRIRNVVATADSQLWITTSNRDGRGDPGPDDDRVIQLSLG
jgi:glucose/arabinose dehydrogenase